MASVSICSDFGAQESKVCHCYHCLPIYLPWSDRTRCHNLRFFECWVLSQLFHSIFSPSSRGSSVPLLFLPLGWCHLHIWGYWYFSWQSCIILTGTYLLNLMWWELRTPVLSTDSSPQLSLTPTLCDCLFLFQILKIGMWQGRDRDDADVYKREAVIHKGLGSGFRLPEFHFCLLYLWASSVCDSVPHI